MKDQPIMNSEELLFFQDREALLPLYITIKRQIIELSPGVTVKTQKTQISFILQRPFAWVWFPPRKKIKGRPAQYLVLSFASDDAAQSPIIQERVLIKPGLYTNQAILSDFSQIGEELAGLLRSSLMLRNPKKQADLC